MDRTLNTSTRDPRRHARVASAMAALLATAVASSALAQPSPKRDGDIAFGACDAPGVFRTFASKTGETLSTTYGPTGWAGNVFIDVSPTDSNCTGASPSLSCLAGVVNVKAPTPADAGVPSSSKVTLSSTRAFTAADVGSEARWSTQTTLATDTNQTCTQSYRFHVTNDGGGWGDPHLTTVDGVQYDFQGAGEFTALRQKTLEIQTRQTPVPTATVPITNPYTGITHCVAIYTAVAARLGSTRITLQPGLANGEASPEGMQLRVNGTLATLTDRGIVLHDKGGKAVEGVIRKAATGAFEITDADGTQLVVTPAYWDSQKVWYLNVNVYQTWATLGTMGKISQGGWLPALPDGSSLGPKPESEDERYDQLYKKFADAWRVTDATSLFDYAQGQNTATFTRTEWPRNHPKTCDIEGQVSVVATTATVAAEACHGVTDPVRRANCEFDVAITGNTGFGKSYEAMQAFHPTGSGWVDVNLGGGGGGGDTPPPASSWWIKWWWVILLALLLVVIVVRLARRPGP